MKKLLAYILLLVYFCVSTGFVVSMHYCMNEIDSVKVGAAASDACSKCGMPADDNNGCCRDEVKVVKLQVDKQVAKMLLFSFAPAPADLPLSRHLHLPFQNFQPAHIVFATGPPLFSNQPLYLSNRVFRI